MQYSEAINRSKTVYVNNILDSEVDKSMYIIMQSVSDIVRDITMNYAAMLCRILVCW